MKHKYTIFEFLPRTRKKAFGYAIICTSPFNLYDALILHPEIPLHLHHLADEFYLALESVGFYIFRNSNKYSSPC